MEWLQANWKEVGVVVLAALNLASAVAAITRTKKDDAIVKKIKDFFLMLVSIK